MRVRLLLTGLVAATMLVSACSGGSPTASWKTGKDILDALESAGFSCEWSGDGEQVVQTNPFTGDDSDYPTVKCDGYVVGLLESKDALITSFTDQEDACKPLTEEELQSPLIQMELVLGDNFVVLPVANFPGEAQPEDFVKAFGGEALTLLDFYSLVCPDVPVPDTSSASAPADKSALESALISAATAMETEYTNVGSYPESLDAVTVDSPEGVQLRLASVSASGFCLEAEDSGGNLSYYDSEAGGLTDTPC